MLLRHCIFTVTLLCGGFFVTLAQAESFAAWKARTAQEAIAEGIPEAVVKEVFATLYQDQKVVRLDRKQPEDKITFATYLRNTVTAGRIQQGRALYAKHKSLLDAISRHYGVPPQIILALWGIETSYGGYKGGFHIVNSLATLAYEGRRAEFFRNELMVALRMIANGEASEAEMLGSWAGAMGHCQFMPTSFQKYAVDWNKDGRKDIWNSLPDVFASIANYLKTEGWNSEQTWGRQVRLPQGMQLTREDLYTKRSLADIAALGVTRVDGSALPSREMDAYLMVPDETHTSAYVVYQNYHVLLHWNKSRFFATSVGTLADAIAGR